eukprot:CAMPEP_0114493714 /NCGR_PEP_ID=MMETSP0109-20121206/4254_1 /TAXON_ID=29199 /ORGANISM="Chlorarachnion reptans, Strain CCCM449" /LENGTH=702 /DNA_ID=CAMNT_0001670679 /DNA_START=35 /DNA_END=2143 /DNA_ORIENTATION=+
MRLSGSASGSSNRSQKVGGNANSTPMVQEGDRFSTASRNSAGSLRNPPLFDIANGTPRSARSKIANSDILLSPSTPSSTQHEVDIWGFPSLQQGPFDVKFFNSSNKSTPRASLNKDFQLRRSSQCFTPSRRNTLHSRASSASPRPRGSSLVTARSARTDERRVHSAKAQGARTANSRRSEMYWAEVKADVHGRRMVPIPPIMTNQLSRRSSQIASPQCRPPPTPRVLNSSSSKKAHHWSNSQSKEHLFGSRRDNSPDHIPTDSSAGVEPRGGANSPDVRKTTEIVPQQQRRISTPPEHRGSNSLSNETAGNFGQQHQSEVVQIDGSMQRQQRLFNNERMIDGKLGPFTQHKPRNVPAPQIFSPQGEVHSRMATSRLQLSNGRRRYSMSPPNRSAVNPTNRNPLHYSPEQFHSKRRQHIGQENRSATPPPSEFRFEDQKSRRFQSGYGPRLNFAGRSAAFMNENMEVHRAHQLQNHFQMAQQGGVNAKFGGSSTMHNPRPWQTEQNFAHLRSYSHPPLPHNYHHQHQVSHYNLPYEQVKSLAGHYQMQASTERKFEQQFERIVYRGSRYIGPTITNRPTYKSKQTWKYRIYPHGVSEQNGKLRVQIKRKGVNPTYPPFPNNMKGLLDAAWFRDQETYRLWKAGILVRKPKFNFEHPHQAQPQFQAFGAGGGDVTSRRDWRHQSSPEGRSPQRTNSPSSMTWEK